MKDTAQPGSDTADLVRGPSNVSAEQGIDDLGPTGLLIVVLNPGVEDLVLAVFRPGLGDGFELDVRRPFRQAHGTPFRRMGTEIGLDRLHLLQRQGQDPAAADLHELFVRDVEPDFAYNRFGMQLDPRQVERGTVLFPLFPAEDIGLLDQTVGQKIPRNLLGCLTVPFRGVEEVFDRRAHLLRFLERSAENVLDRRGSAAGDVVRHPRSIADDYQPVKRFFRTGLAEGTDLGDRIRKRLEDRPGYLFRFVQFQGIDLPYLDTPQRQFQERTDLPFHRPCFRVIKPLLCPNFQTVLHWTLPVVKRKDQRPTPRHPNHAKLYRLPPPMTSLERNLGRASHTGTRGRKIFFWDSHSDEGNLRRFSS